VLGFCLDMRSSPSILLVIIVNTSFAHCYEIELHLFAWVVIDRENGPIPFRIGNPRTGKPIWLIDFNWDTHVKSPALFFKTKYEKATICFGRIGAAITLIAVSKEDHVIVIIERAYSLVTCMRFSRNLRCDSVGETVSIGRLCSSIIRNCGSGNQGIPQNRLIQILKSSM